MRLERPRQKFSVVVPAYNCEGTIAKCLEALLHQSVPPDRYEVIVVDDGSADNTGQIVQRYPVCLIQQEHSGPAAARNKGAKEASGTVILFTDADCEPTFTWMESLVRHIQGDVVGAKGTYLSRQSGLIPRLVQAEYEEKYDHIRKSSHMDYIDTYSAAYRRDVFLENGGFDTGFNTASVEDHELSFRLAEQGYRLVFVPEAAVYHRHSETVSRYWQRKFNIGYWKAYLHRTHPQKLFSDSHTPFSLRLQVVLLGIVFLCLVAGAFVRPLFWGAAGALGLFLASVAPFSIRAASKDAAVAFVAPAGFALRALALGLGFCIGILRFGGGALRSGLARATKRAIDLAGATIALLVCWPLMLGVALWIRLDSPGPVLFVQERVGENGRLFMMYKFRSMFHNSTNSASDELEELRLRQPNFKLKDDPRVTTSGRFLRRTSLDELPQLINVVKGDLSLVGPRPEEPKVVSLYNHWHRQRLTVRPGLTGPMQVNGRGDLPLDERVRLELAYIRNPSPWKDLVILVRTIPTLLRGRGAY